MQKLPLPVRKPPVLALSVNRKVDSHCRMLASGSRWRLRVTRGRGGKRKGGGGGEMFEQPELHGCPGCGSGLHQRQCIPSACTSFHQSNLDPFSRTSLHNSSACRRGPGPLAQSKVPVSLAACLYSRPLGVMAATACSPGRQDCVLLDGKIASLAPASRSRQASDKIAHLVGAHRYRVYV